MSSEEIVQGQLDAYNARDIDLFMTFWSEEALYFEHPSKLLASGGDEIRARQITRFEDPDLFGKLVKRVTIDNKVIDHEIVSRNFPAGSGSIEVMAIYEVIGSKVVKAWFILGQPTIDPIDHYNTL